MSLVIAKKYSKVLLEVAQEKNELEAVLAETASIASVLEQSGLAHFLKDPVVPADQKAAAISTLKSQTSETMSHFLDVLTNNNRLDMLDEIVAEVKGLADELFKISDVVITTATPLTEGQIAKFEQAAKNKFNLNQVNLVQNVDASILGGFVMDARGKIIDASIKKQLTAIAKEII